MPDSPGVIVIAYVSCQPGRRDNLVALLTDLQDASRRDEGCLRYGFSSRIEDPEAFVAVEEWASQEALAAHLREPHIADFARRAPALLAGAPEVTAHEVHGSGPLPPIR